MTYDWTGLLFLILYYIISVQQIVSQQEPSLVRFSELETTGLGNQFSQGIDRSVVTNNNLTRQDETTQGEWRVTIIIILYLYVLLCLIFKISMAYYNS